MSDFEYFIEISHYHHLLVELRTLSQTCLLSKVIQSKNLSSTFRWSSYDFRSMDFNEAILGKVFSVKLTNSRLNSKNGLWSRCSEIQYSVIKSCFQAHNCLSFFYFNSFFFLDVLISVGIIHLERQNIFRSRNYVELLNLNFNIFQSTAFNRLFNLFDDSFYIHDWFWRYLLNVLHAIFRKSVRLKGSTLQSVKVLS